MCKSNVSCICVVPIAIFTVILIMIIVIYFEVSWMEELNAAESGKSHQHLRKKIKNKLFRLIRNLEVSENDVFESRPSRSYYHKRTRTTTTTRKPTTTKRRKTTTTTTTKEPEPTTTTRKPTTSSTRKPTTTRRPKTTRKPEKTHIDRIPQHTPVGFKVSTTPEYMEPTTTEVGEKEPPEWLSLSANAFNMWMHECRERDEASDEGEDITDVEANFPYDKYSLKLTYLSNPSLHPIAAIVHVVKKILIGTFFLGVVFLIFIVMAFTKVKQTSGIGYLTDRLSNINSFQSIINHFRASHAEKTDDSVIVLHSPTSSRSSVVSLSTILEETSPLLLCQDDLLEHLQSDDELRSVVGTS